MGGSRNGHQGFAEGQPEISNLIDPAPDLTTKAALIVRNGRELLKITQTGEFEGGEQLLEIQNGIARRIATDTIIDFQALDNNISISEKAAGTSCGASSSADHDAVHEAAKSAVDVFSSATGPDGGNLACVWAVRHLVFKTLNRWITKTDGTAVFGPELRQCFGASLAETSVPAGGIVISPTSGSSIGHVGILGPSTGSGSRLIYSNSSSAAMWKQNFTLDRWIQRYKETKGLSVRFFPLPLRQAIPTS